METSHKSRDELASELLALKEAYDSLNSLYNNERAALKSAEFLHAERLKELNFHNRMSKIMGNPAFSVDQVLKQVVTFIPDAWQFSEIAEALILAEGKTYKSGNFRPTRWIQSKELLVFGKVAGKIEVCYQESELINPENPFLKEEDDLIQSIAERLGSFIERSRITISLQESEMRYRKLLQNVMDVIYETDNKGVITYISPSIEKLLGFSQDELIGKSFLQFVGTNADYLAQRFVELSLKGEVENDYQIFSKTGESHWIRFSTKALVKEGVFWGGIGTLVDITEKKQIELDLQKSESMYRSILHASPDVITITDLEGKIRFSSPKSKEMFGLQHHEETINHSLLEYIAEKDHARATFNISKMSEGDFGAKVYTGVRKDGSTFGIEVNGEFVRDANGQPTGMIFVTRDISERKQTKEELRRLYRAVEQSPVSVVITDLQAQIEYVNPAFEEITGYCSEEVIGRSTRILKSGETANETYKEMWETITSGNEWQSEWLNRRKNGELYWESILITPVHDEEGVITNYLAVKQDITKKKEAEREILNLNANLELKIQERTTEIRLSEEKFATAFQFNSAMMAISEFESGEFVDVNKAFAEALGYSREELIGKTNSELRLFMDPGTREELLRKFEHNISIDKYEILMRTKEGEIKTGLLSANEIFIGAKRCFLSATIDITERKRMEDDLRKARIEADLANQAKSEFLSRMSHELRTPMNSILGFAQLLELGTMNAGQRKGVAHILKSGRHLLDLINEVLDISRIEAGKLALSLEPVQVIGIVQESMDFVRIQAQGKHLTLEFVDSFVNQLFVISDRQRLKQVLLNLINNAIKYNKIGGTVTIKTELREGCSEENRTIRISIVDTGIGIDAEDIPKIFVPFERVGAEKIATEGTGLGLAVVQKLIEAMGGSVGVESVLGAGCTFWIELPHSESQLDLLERSGQLDRLNSFHETRSGTILYVEDNLSNIELIEQVLVNQRSSLRLITLTSGKPAFEMVLSQKPDLVLLDLNLPDMGGEEVLLLLQTCEQTKEVPVVIISADAMQHQFERLLKKGAKNYLTKPLDLIELLKLIDKYIT